MENEVLNPAGEVKVKLEYRIDRLEKIVKCMGNTEEIEKLLNRLDALSAKCESLEKRVAYYKSEAAGGFREAHRDRDELYTKFRSAYDMISRALTEFDACYEPGDDDSDYDPGFALYEEICNIQGTMALEGGF